MKTLLLAVILGMTILAAAHAETGTWHRDRIYDIGSPRPAGQPSPFSGR